MIMERVSFSHLHDSRLWQRVLDENTNSRSEMQLNHVQQNAVVFSRFSSWKWFGPFCQQSQQDTNEKSIYITSSLTANSRYVL